MERNSGIDFCEDNDIEVVTDYQADRCVMLARVLHTLHEAQKTVDARRFAPKNVSYPSDVDKSLTVRVDLDPAFMRSMGHIALSLFMDLREEGLQNVGSDIVHNSHFSYNGKTKG